MRVTVHLLVLSHSTNGSGDKVGLGFTVTTSCTPTLVTDEEEGAPYPTAVIGRFPSLRVFTRLCMGHLHFGKADNYAKGSYLYHNVHHNGLPATSLFGLSSC